MISRHWHHSLGIRPAEIPTVRLFFLHHFLLGIGTILVYVAANVTLLEHHPETSLPLAYLIGALATLAVGKLYGYFEHHLPMNRLTVGVLLVVTALTLVVVTLVAFGHSVTSAIALMVAYRLIYLLTSLEFWGVSAVVFDVRQGKRLFSIISSGDMPAKALGALLTVLVHSPQALEILLIGAFAAFGLSILLLLKTFRSHRITPGHRSTWRHRLQPTLIRHLFGGNRLIYVMSMSLLSIAVVAAGIEYAFFVYVKHQFHNQASLIQTIGLVLALTYLAAMGVKLLLSRRAIDRLGMKRLLLLLPAAALAAVSGYWLVGPAGLVLYFCSLYALFEVVRRALFEPAFLVLFQPLTPRQRLQGHTLAKSVYEPLGTALAGGLLLTGSLLLPEAEWLPFVWMLPVAALTGWLLHRTYRHYLHELDDALAQRFLADEHLAFPAEAVSILVRNLRSDRTEEVLTAIDWLRRHQPEALGRRITDLLRHPDNPVVTRALDAVTELSISVDAGFLTSLAETTSSPAIQEAAARLACRQPGTDSALRNRLVNHPQRSIRKGALRGCLEASDTDPAAVAGLESLSQSAFTDDRIAALDLIRTLSWSRSEAFVEACLASDDPAVQRAAIRAVGTLKFPRLLPALADRLLDRDVGKTALYCLAEAGSEALPVLEQALRTGASPHRLIRLAAVCERIPTPESSRLLAAILKQDDRRVRAAALRSLSRMPALPERSVLHGLLQDEWQLAGFLLTARQHEFHLATTIQHELVLLQERVFSILTLLYDAEAVQRVRLGVLHGRGERRANALEVLENLVPRTVYKSLQAIVDDLPLAERLSLLPVGPATTGPVLPTIIRLGETVFSDWTIGLALRQWTPVPDDLPNLLPYLNHSTQLLRECALQTLAAYSQRHPESSHSLVTTMNNTRTISRIPHLERVLILKNTRLFADTPENILSSVAPIMREVTFTEGQEIVAKGEVATCLYIIHTGEVGVYDQFQSLARLGKGNFFGELALLDAEPRSATVVALSDVSLLRIDQDDFYDLMDERGEVLRNIIRSLCQRIRSQNEQLKRLPVAPGADAH